MSEDSKQSIIIIEGESDLTKVARDLAQVEADLARSAADLQQAESDLAGSPDVEDLDGRIANEVASAAEIVKGYEADAVAKGFAVKLSGVRYKIYETITE